MGVGAGPAGLEAAVRAAEAGHRVELHEKSDRIGGQLWIAGTPPHKHGLWELVTYYDALLDKYDIEVVLGHEVTADFIKEEKPDHVIVAEGAEPLTPRIDGIDDPKVLSAWHVLEKDPMIGPSIAVIGGGAVGLETAEFLAAKGTLPAEAMHFLFMYEAETVERLRELCTRGTKKVTVFEMLPKAARDVGRSTRWVLMGSVERYGIDIITGAKVTSMKNGTVTFERNGAAESMKFDAIVNAVGSRSVRNVSDAMEKTGIPYTIVGDAKKIGQIDKAIHDGFLAVMNIR